jgi:tRNA nucleotidyltransferase (CCA-adding enzyme)
MTDRYIGHSQIASFADEKINLKEEDVIEHRAQVNRLRDNLKVYIDEHPDYNLIKMLNSGSVAKGTALKTLNDMDVAIYIKKTARELTDTELINWMVERLREAYKNKGLSSDQIQPSTHCATISFKGSGLDVDVSPVIYEGGADDIGYLINKDTGDKVLTSIPLHLKFIRDRKNKQPHHFRQLVRLVKWWVRNQKRENEKFRFKSFMIEMICAHLVDNKIDLSDYVRSLDEFFKFIVTSQLHQRIYFTDNYSKDKLPSKTSSVIEIFDPVNPSNNVASSYSESDRFLIVERAHDAFDSIHEAEYANTQGRATDCWKRILGPSFNF